MGYSEGKVLFEGGEFRRRAVETFTISSPAPPATVLSSSPSSFPSGSPSSSPSVAPTSQPCAGSLFKINLKTDAYGYETKWAFRNKKTNAIIEKGIERYENNKAYEFPGPDDAYCLPRGECYIFQITDLYGDGLCCNYGQGKYEGFLDGKSIFEGSRFRSIDSKEFCVPSSS